MIIICAGSQPWVYFTEVPVRALIRVGTALHCSSLQPLPPARPLPLPPTRPLSRPPFSFSLRWPDRITCSRNIIDFRLIYCRFLTNVIFVTLMILWNYQSSPCIFHSRESNGHIYQHRICRVNFHFSSKFSCNLPPVYPRSESLSCSNFRFTFLTAFTHTFHSHTCM